MDYKSGVYLMTITNNRESKNMPMWSPELFRIATEVVEVQFSRRLKMLEYSLELIQGRIVKATSYRDSVNIKNAAIILKNHTMH
jgi:hypothetical protein